MSHEHHQQADQPEEHRCGEVVKQDQGADDAHATDDPIKGRLFREANADFTEQEGHVDDAGQLGHLRGLKLNAKEADPARGIVHADADKRHGRQQDDGQDHQDRAAHGEVTRRHTRQAQDAEEADRKVHGMARDGRPDVRLVVGQRAGGAEHLHQREATEEHEDDPDRNVALEHFPGKRLLRHGRASFPSASAWTHCLNCSPRSS